MYRVQLDHFEGPLDLLLFFIRRDELDIHDIPIARITDEYLEAVWVLEQIDLDAAADFIYTAALLIQIKARMLMPRPELDEEGEPVDPRQELVDRLLEYVRYKEAAGTPAGRFEARQRLYTRGQASDERERLGPDEDEITYRATLFDLVRALGAAIDRSLEAQADDVRHAIARESYALDEQRDWVLRRVAQGGASFRALVAQRSKAFVIVTFLAVLDLAQRQAVRIVFGFEPEDFAVEPTASGGEEEVPVQPTAAAA